MHTTRDIFHHIFINTPTSFICFHATHQISPNATARLAANQEKHTKENADNDARFAQSPQFLNHNWGL
jgi:hypothetical protein